MRIIPANFDEMEEKYISGLAKLVHQYKIPPDLVYEQDEINAQFSSLFFLNSFALAYPSRILLLFAFAASAAVMS